MLKAVAEVSHLFHVTYYEIRMKFWRKKEGIFNVRNDYKHAMPVSILDWQCTEINGQFVFYNGEDDL